VLVGPRGSGTGGGVGGGGPYLAWVTFATGLDVAMNGRELLALIKEDPDLRSIPVVVLTTSNAPSDVASAYQCHANAYVTKPVSLDAFSEAVHSIDAFFLDTAQLPPA
jgi:CheY-like chemotaxis protein